MRNLLLKHMFTFSLGLCSLKLLGSVCLMDTNNKSQKVFLHFSLKLLTFHLCVLNIVTTRLGPGNNMSETLMLN